MNKSIPIKAIENILCEVMEQARNNGANSVSMPDDYVAIAHFIAYPEEYAIDPGRWTLKPKGARGVMCEVFDADGKRIAEGYQLECRMLVDAHNASLPNPASQVSPSMALPSKPVRDDLITGTGAEAPRGALVSVCPGCDPAEGFCAQCREEEKRATQPPTAPVLDKRAKFEAWSIAEREKFAGHPLDAAEKEYLLRRLPGDRDTYSYAPAEWPAFQGGYRAAQQAATCTTPPAGWRCTREAGHDGPCAALPAFE